jgi:membrane protein
MVWAALKGWSRDDVPRLGASLAYYTLFSIGPILLIAIAIAGIGFGADAVRNRIVEQLDGLIGREGARAIQALLEGAHQERAGVMAIVVGTVTFLVASTGAFLELQHALNTIFQVKVDPKENRLKALFKDRLRSFGLVVSIGFLLLVSLAVSAALAALSRWVSATDLGVAELWQAVDVVVSLGVITVLFGLIYRYLPDVRLRWSDVWVGACVTAILFLLGKQLIGLYLGRSSVATSYGAAGSVVVLLLWVYYSAQLVLFGAELTRVYAGREGGPPPPNGFARRDRGRRPEAPTVPRRAGSRRRNRSQRSERDD